MKMERLKRQMENFKEQLTSQVDFINDIIDERLPKEEGYALEVIKAMNYSVDAGGKRIRPLIMLESYRLCGGNDCNVLYDFMAALECIHTYSLVHDDLPAMDNDEYRRGKLTTHKAFGEDMAILAGDGLLNYAAELILNRVNEISKDAKEKINKLLDSDLNEANMTIVKDKIKAETKRITNVTNAANVILSKAGIYGMVGGQCLDVYLTNKPVKAEELDYIFKNKTAALIECAFMAGGYLAGANEETIAKLELAGRFIGLAFQIQDDILDVTSTTDELGKPVGSDDKNNKTTYVTLYGMDKANEDVNSYSRKGIEILEEIGNNEFLIELAVMLIGRKK